MPPRNENLSVLQRFCLSNCIDIGKGMTSVLFWFILSLICCFLKNTVNFLLHKTMCMKNSARSLAKLRLSNVKKSF